MHCNFNLFFSVFQLAVGFTCKPKDHHTKPHGCLSFYHCFPNKSGDITLKRQRKPEENELNQFDKFSVPISCFSRANGVMFVCHASGRCAHLVSSVLYPSSRIINPFLEGLLSYRGISLLVPYILTPGGGGEGVTPGTSRWACAARPVLQTLTLFHTKNVSFHSLFQTWPLKSISTLRSFL